MSNNYMHIETINKGLRRTDEQLCVFPANWKGNLDERKKCNDHRSK